MEQLQALFELYIGNIEITPPTSYTITSKDTFKTWIETFKRMDPFNSYTYIMIEAYLFQNDSSQFIEVPSISQQIISPSTPTSSIRIKFVFHTNPHYQKIIESKYLPSSANSVEPTLSHSKTVRKSDVIELSSDSSSHGHSKTIRPTIPTKQSRLQRDSNGKRVFAPSGTKVNGEHSQEMKEFEEDSDYEIRRKKKRNKAPKMVVEEVTFFEAVQGGDLDVVEAFLDEDEDINQLDEVSSWTMNVFR